MYQPKLTLRDRAGPLSGVVLIHLALGYALLHLSGAGAELAKQADLAIFDVFVPPPPPPPVEQRSHQPPKHKASQGAASPKNIVSKATPIVAPKPPIVLPAPSPIVAATQPSTGANVTSGASNVVGPGTGAGGIGNGSGSGGAGGGSGSGGGGGLGEARARLLTPPLTRRDIPQSLYRRAPRGASVFMIIRVAANGIPLSCQVSRSFGDPVIDAETCRLVVERLRFAPSRDEQGHPVADFFGYRQQF